MLLIGGGGQQRKQVFLVYCSKPITENHSNYAAGASATITKTHPSLLACGAARWKYPSVHEKTSLLTCIIKCSLQQELHLQ